MTETLYNARRKAENIIKANSEILNDITDKISKFAELNNPYEVMSQSLMAKEIIEVIHSSAKAIKEMDLVSHNQIHNDK